MQLKMAGPREPEIEGGKIVRLPQLMYIFLIIASHAHLVFQSRIEEKMLLFAYFSCQRNQGIPLRYRTHSTYPLRRYL